MQVILFPIFAALLSTVLSENSLSSSTVQATSASTTFSTTSAIDSLSILAGAGSGVAKFTGGSILTGSCSTPQFTSAVTGSGPTLQYALVGCSNQRLDCCAFGNNVGGGLGQCPADYFTTSGACCPTGWSVYSSQIAGQTYCYTRPASTLTPPSTASASGSVAFSAITSDLFTLKYQLVPSKSGLSGGAKAGIAVGVILAVAFLAAFVFCIIRTRTRRLSRTSEADPPTDANADSNAAELPVTLDSFRASSPRASLPPINAGHLSELPSPTVRPPVESPQHEEPHDQPDRVRSTPTAPQELVGDTYMHEHHPAFTPTAAEAPRPASFVDGDDKRVSLTPGDIVSPMESGELE